MPGTALTKQQKHLVNKYHDTFLAFLAFAVFFRLLITAVESYPIDMAGYVAWSNFLADNGPSELYGSSGFHIVYAPFYQYFLWITGEIVRLFSLTDALHAYLIKLWSVGFEFVGAWLILRLSIRMDRLKSGAIAAMLYVMNPGIFINSSIWGQFDSIPATMLLGVILLFESKRPNLAALLFLTAVLTKPQSGLLLPVVLSLYFKNFRFEFKSFRRLLLGLFSGVLLYLAIVMPFYIPTPKAGQIPGFLDPFYWLFDLYFRSIQDYPFATANGFNLWTLLGGQIQNDTMPFMGLSYLWWGNILLFLSLAYAFVCLVKGKGDTYALIYFSFLTLFSAFFFMTKMHERYLLPAIIFIMLAAVFDKRHVTTGVLLSLCVFCNHLYLYIISFRNQYWIDRWDTTAILIALLTLVVYVLALVQGYKAFIQGKNGKAVQGGKR